MTPGLAQWVDNLALLWLWHRLAAVAPTGPLAWESPQAVQERPQKRQKDKKRKKEKKEKKCQDGTDF